MHDYHFLITDKIVLDLNNIKELNSFSFSKKVNYILSMIKNISKYLENLNFNEKNNVEYLESKKDVHLYIRNRLFEKMKFYHGKFNSYSMALYVRMILRLFITMNKKYGFNLTLKKINKVSQKLKNINYKKSKKYIIIQLLNILNLKSNKNLKLKDILSILLL